MTNKITLITPPDIYENANFSILLIGMTEHDQDQASGWLGINTSMPPTNLYVYQGEPNLTWLFYAANRADIVFINVDVDNAIIKTLASYIASKDNVWYTTKNLDMKELLSHISNKFINNIDDFLEKAYQNDQDK